MSRQVFYSDGSPSRELVDDEEPETVDPRDRRMAELEAAIRGILPFTLACEQKTFLRQGIGTDTPSGRAWLKLFSALGEPIKVK